MIEERRTSVKRAVQAFLASMFISTTVLSATAQQALQPVVRLGNFLEVDNDVFMHIIASADIRWHGCPWPRAQHGKPGLPHRALLD